MRTDQKILLIGIGNNCRGDDGLGWKFVELVEAMGLDFIHCEFRYQLQVEDAALISEYDTVYFVDATYEKLMDGFTVRPCAATSEEQFSTHAQSPEAILNLANTLYKQFPEAYLLAIAGESWELETSLSEAAKKNLVDAVSFFAELFFETEETESVFKG
ncbi:MAG: hydrogenase maturation protease [Flavisolibacter sp.]